MMPYGNRRIRAFARTLLESALLLAFGPVSAGGYSSFDALCPARSHETDLTLTYGAGDGAFQRGKYRLAAREYYRLYFCYRQTVLNARYSEVGDAYATLRDGVGLAAAGDFTSAVTRLRAAERGLPEMTEAGYLAGIFEWAGGDEAGARRSWRQTADGPFLPLPDDIPDVAQTEAKRMLQWSLRRP